MVTPPPHSFHPTDLKEQSHLSRKKLILGSIIGPEMEIPNLCRGTQVIQNYPNSFRKAPASSVAFKSG